MNGKYYGIYNMRREDECLGVFESTKEMCAFFGGVDKVSKSRIWCAIARKNPITIRTARFWIQVYEEPTEGGVCRRLRKRGYKLTKINNDGVFVRKHRNEAWQLFAADFLEADRLLKQLPEDYWDAV